MWGPPLPTVPTRLCPCLLYTPSFASLARETRAHLRLPPAGCCCHILPIPLLALAGVFFSLILFNDALLPMIASLGTTPLMLAVFVGAAQNIISKGSKYALFDPCKEMAYIPLDAVSPAAHTAHLWHLPRRAHHSFTLAHTARAHHIHTITPTVIIGVEDEGEGGS